MTSVAANGASMATRVPLEALAPLLANTSVIAAVRAYLGPDALLDGYKAVRLAPTASEAENIAGLWHNDRAGNRLKLFVRLHDVDPRPEAGGHPTLVARGSHELLQWSVEGYEHSRYYDATVRSEFTVAAIGGGAGGGFIFDTNTIHRAVPEGLLGRTVIVRQDVVHTGGRLNRPGVGAILEPVGAGAVALGRAAGRWVLAFGACLCLELEPCSDGGGGLAMLA